MKYSELDIKSLSDSEIYDLVMSGIVDYSKKEITPENNPDLLMVLGCSPLLMKARIVKMMHLYKQGYGKYVILTGGIGWHKLFKIENKKFKNEDERASYMKLKKKKYKKMKIALHKSIPNEFKPSPNSNKRGKSLYRYMHKKMEENLEATEVDIGYKIINSCKDIVDIDDDKIFIESNSKNTIENMKYSKEMLDNLKKSGQISDIKRVMIITSSFHCKRAMLSMKKYFPDVEVMSCPSTNDLTEKGSIFNKESMMKNPYYMDQFRKELNAIVSYTRNGSIYDDEIDVNIRDKNDDVGR